MDRAFGLLLLMAVAPVAGKQLYKYQDETGAWHFTDEKPDTPQPVQAQLVRVARQPPRLFVTCSQVGRAGVR